MPCMWPSQWFGVSSINTINEATARTTTSLVGNQFWMTITVPTLMLRSFQSASQPSIWPPFNHDLGLFCWSTKGPLVFLNEPLNAAAFIEQVYDPALLPFFNQMANAPYIQGCQNIAMMEDGAPIHTACLSNAIAKLPWPAHSPDFNPIENIWRKMKSCIIKHYNPHTIPCGPSLQNA
ncbi:hypothetical protein O181_100832 [Austropuccinia psidii MF-1]|uniref:Tc1-like transposase DDE domain-containing protein n=1 Tax=Austropuccinia psidii MF-1 TaxID=1389203 RepID=A0A9Q3JEU9_9BASI|nr:hypothetical protein [Austropuccinia psidii MF-1]